MAKIQLVIEIEERYYEIIKNDVERGMDYMPCVIIAKGQPLPKSHGRLIDADSIKYDDYENLLIRSETIMRTPTIIEKYRGGGEDEDR